MRVPADTRPSVCHNPRVQNLLNQLPPDTGKEIFETLLQTESFVLERIVTRGQITPEGSWYDQSRPEWVFVLSGRAELVFESPDETIPMEAGDAVHIEANRRHRVSWVDEAEPVIWLCLHYSP